MHHSSHFKSYQSSCSNAALIIWLKISPFWSSCFSSPAQMLRTLLWKVFGIEMQKPVSSFTFTTCQEPCTHLKALCPCPDFFSMLFFSSFWTVWRGNASALNAIGSLSSHSRRSQWCPEIQQRTLAFIEQKQKPKYVECMNNMGDMWFLDCCIFNTFSPKYQIHRQYKSCYRHTLVLDSAFFLGGGI